MTVSKSGNEQEWPEVWMSRSHGISFLTATYERANAEAIGDEVTPYVPASFLAEERERHARVVEQLAECYRVTGSEPSGVESEDAMYAVRAVEELREEYDECPAPEDLAKERERLEKLEAAVRDTLCDDDLCARCLHLHDALTDRGGSDD